jgi:hypothetical protein
LGYGENFSLFKYWKYDLNIIVFRSWIKKNPLKIVPRLPNIPRVATGATLEYVKLMIKHHAWSL